MVGAGKAWCHSDKDMPVCWGRGTQEIFQNVDAQPYKGKIWGGGNVAARKNPKVGIAAPVGYGAIKTVVIICK